MAGNRIKGRWKGMDTLDRWLTRIPAKTDETVRFTFHNIMDHAATRVVLNAPVKTGDLRRSVHRQPISGTLGRGYRSQIEVRVKYALDVHENLEFLGATSRQQPGTSEGGVGRKYVERVMKFNFNRWTKLFGLAIKNTWENIN